MSSQKTREAFPAKKGSKPVVTNIDTIIRNSQLKMKEFMTKKQEIDDQTNLLLGKDKLLSENINKVQSDINEKKKIKLDKENEYQEILNEIKELEEQNKKVLKNANEQEAYFKDGINYINSQLDTIKNGTIPENASKNFEIKRTVEEVNKYKEENNKLREKLYMLTRRLNELEIEYNEFSTDEVTNEKKAENGIETINKMFENHLKREQQKMEDDEIDENEENNNNEENDENNNNNNQQGNVNEQHVDSNQDNNNANNNNEGSPN